MTHYLLRRPGVGYVGGIAVDSAWTLSRHLAHTWVDPMQAALAARRWFQLHGEELKVEPITVIASSNGLTTWVA